MDENGSRISRRTQINNNVCRSLIGFIIWVWLKYRLSLDIDKRLTLVRPRGRGVKSFGCGTICTWVVLRRDNSVCPVRLSAAYRNPRKCSSPRESPCPSRPLALSLLCPQQVLFLEWNVRCFRLTTFRT